MIRGRGEGKALLVLPAAVLVLVAIVATAGCGGGDPRDERAEERVAWLKEYGRWQADVRATTATAGASGIPRLTRLRNCEREEEWLAEAPDDLERGARHAREACKRFARAAATHAGIEPDAPPGEAQIRLRDDLEQAAYYLSKSQVEISQRLTASRRLPVVAGPSEDSRVERTLSRVASEIAHGEVEARCWSDAEWEQVVRELSAFSATPPDYAGFVAFDDERLHLAPFVCAPLAELVYRDVRPRNGVAKTALAFAVVALTHEAGHLLGGASEAVTECYAMQRADGVAVRLGAGHAYARELVDLYWKEEYPAHTADYFSEDCVDGGALDLAPDNPEWP